MQTFKEELQSLINKHGRSGASGTPDHVLAGYIDDCLKVFDKAVDNWRHWEELSRTAAPPANYRPIRAKARRTKRIEY